MKKYLLFCFLVMLGIFRQAQGQNFDLSLTLGFNTSQIHGDNMAGFNQIGLLTGGGATFMFDDQWGFRQEVLWSQKGSRKANDLVFYSIRLNYIELPSLLVFKPTSNIEAFTGLSYNYLVNAKINASGIFVNDAGLLKRGDFSGHIGGAYCFSDRLSVSVRSSFSILSIAKVSVNNNYRNWAIGFATHLRLTSK